MQLSQPDQLWLLICTALVFMMQGGFLCLESGLTRSKHAINVALKNLSDSSIAFLLFWVFGFALMFGDSWFGIVGCSRFSMPFQDGSLTMAIPFLFQAVFCATAATIVSGAVAGRMRFTGYLFITVVISGLIYPVVGHWSWGGLFGGTVGWLSDLGFRDFAGSIVVHGVGGAVALAAVMVLGPRHGRFESENHSNRELGHNIPMAMLGTMMLAFGWIGFNGGSTFALNDQVGGIVINTLLAGASGTVAAMVLSSRFTSYVDIHSTINGSIAGLVAITASCNAVSPMTAILIGAIGAAVMLLADYSLQKLKIDDAIGAFPVHAVAGVWGALGVGIFGDLEI